jgi:hypothetical protein
MVIRRFLTLAEIVSKAIVGPPLCLASYAPPALVLCDSDNEAILFPMLWRCGSMTTEGSATLKVQQPRKLSFSLWSIYTPPSGHKFKAAILKASLQQLKQPKKNGKQSLQQLSKPPK